MAKSKRASFEFDLMIFLMVIESIPAIYCGSSLLGDSVGENSGLTIKLLTVTGFADYSQPLKIILTAFGLMPLTLIYPLLFKPDWPVYNHNCPNNIKRRKAQM